MNKRRIAKLMSLLIVFALVYSGLTTIKSKAAVEGNDLLNEVQIRDEKGYKISGKKSAKWVDEKQEIAEVKFSVTAQKRTETVDEIDSADIVLIIDTSSSMLEVDANGVNKLIKVKDAAKAFAGNLLNGHNNFTFSVISFNDNATSCIKRSNSLSLVQNAIDGITSGKNLGTNIQSALATAEDIVKECKSKKQLVFLLSDGEPTYSYAATGYDLRYSMVTVGLQYLIGYGNNYKITVENGSVSNESRYKIEYVDADSNNQTIIIDNHGVTTIAHAKWFAINHPNATLYAIGYGTQGNVNAEAVMSNMVTNQSLYRLADINTNPYPKAEDILTTLSTSVEKTVNTVTNASLTDVIPDYFTLDTTKLPRNVTYEAGTLTWNLGDISDPEGKDSFTYDLTIYLKIDKSKLNIKKVQEDDNMVETNVSCNLEFNINTEMRASVPTTREIGDGERQNANPKLPVTFKEQPPVNPQPPVDPQPPVNPQPTIISTQPVSPTVTVSPTPTIVPPTPTPVEESEEVPEEELPEGSPVLDQDKISIGSENIKDESIPEGSAKLPQTGTLPVELFYGIGTACIALGGVIAKGKKKEK